MAVNLPPLGELAPVAGVRLATACAGIKQRRRDDLAVIELARESAVAGVFTRNAFRAPPVILAEERIRFGNLRALLINSGNANAATGAGGREDAAVLCGHLARCLGGDCRGESVLPFSTGVIGERLPVDAMRPAIERAVPKLSPAGWKDAARAIMTTDTAPKGESARIEVGGKSVTITGIAKGSGMIKPDMATMLAFLCCDAAIAGPVLQEMTAQVADRSFNRVTVDGDTSTNDSFVVCATGQAGNAEITGSGPAFEALKSGILAVARALAERLVRDGEGATRFVTVRVRGGATESECVKVAYTVAESPLVKTALFAGDPNWGRFCMAIGRAGIEDLDPDAVSLALDEVVIARGGLVADDYDEASAAKVMERDEFTVDIDLGRGACSDAVWTTDLSYEYVRINAEYRT
ncbi:MAG: bifunctional glutamate N-acetyltransferase/amino-acid acetyltransferase ArgJ [Gammaproteobacteria bacterium]|nr:bifunctional glutamate N-acetyltransferase/amino-acid acetyltransferase ArgJ [Gammaproteobacteria bacterium]MDE0365760.1 bifunctional glutamate N-acetyltransferase/amino-acid acetyltransferase ArgJ [Gammaproteobacteria bacterium]